MHRHLVAIIMGALLLGATTLSAFADDWAVGDRVQVYVSGGWYEAVVTGGIGSAPYAGYYSVHFDDGTDSYAKPDAIRPDDAGPASGQNSQ